MAAVRQYHDVASIAVLSECDAGGQLFGSFLTMFSGMGIRALEADYGPSSYPYQYTISGYYTYTVNAGTSDTCEQGSAITSEAECQAAATGLATSHVYRMSVPIGYAPSGCMLYSGPSTESVGYYFNTNTDMNPPGPLQADHYKVCSSWQNTPTTEQVHCSDDWCNDYEDSESPQCCAFYTQYGEVQSCEQGSSVDFGSRPGCSSGGYRCCQSEDPAVQLVTPGALTKAELDNIFTNMWPCVCHYFRTDSNVLELAISKINQWEANAPSDIIVALFDTFKQGMRASTFCGSGSCRDLFESVFALVDKWSVSTMSSTGVTYNGASACADSAARDHCFGTRTCWLDDSCWDGASNDVCKAAPQQLALGPNSGATVSGAEYAYANCAGSPTREWDSEEEGWEVYTSQATSDSTCTAARNLRAGSPAGTTIGGWSIRNEYCDFSGAVPMLQGVYFPSSTTCTGTGLGYGETNNGEMADGRCINYADGTSARHHCKAKLPLPMEYMPDIATRLGYWGSCWVKSECPPADVAGCARLQQSAEP